MAIYLVTIGIEGSAEPEHIIVTASDSRTARRQVCEGLGADGAVVDYSRFNASHKVTKKQAAEWQDKGARCWATI